MTCTADQRVERLPGPYLFGCVTASPAQPVPRVPDVQQGDPCPVFGATTYNPQGAAFDCEPWGPNPTELRWIVP